MKTASTSRDAGRRSRGPGRGPMPALRLMLRMLVRDWRAGELHVLALALVLAVAAMTSVSFLVDRVEQALDTEAHQLLGGDLLLSADHPWDDAFRAEAAARGLRLAESALFPSMANGTGGAQLAEVKAVGEGYPLRGRLRITRVPRADDAEADGIPAPGEVWPDERLAGALAADPGSAISLGRSAPRVSAILTLDPDRGVNAFALAPRLLMNLADLPATGLVVTGSRVAWRLHLAGERPAVDAYRRWAEDHLGRGERLESLDRARPEIRNVLERAQRFLRLAALLAVVLAAVAVGLAAQRYMRRHLDGCAVLRCLGARESQILTIHGGEFLLLGLAATLAGGILGYAMQALLLGMLGGLFPNALPAPGWRPWALGLAVGTVLVAGFILPPLLRLRRASTLRVLRREWEGTAPLSFPAYALGIAALAALMFALADDATLGAVVLGGFAIAIAVYALAARLLLGLAGGVRAGGGWRYGMASLRRRRLSVTVQAVALGLGLTALLLLTVSREGLMASWRSRVPPDAPNRFVINIQPDQRRAVHDLFSVQGLAPPFLEPMVRGRLVAVNGTRVGPETYEDDRAKRLVDREFNLSWADQLPAGNQVVAGRWHGRQAGEEFSVEQGLAETLGLRLGDALTYDVAGRRLSGRITSLRKLDWDSMRVNFFVIAPPGALQGFPASYITSFHLPRDRGDFVNMLVREFPNLTVIDVAALLRQVQTTLDQVATAVQAVFGFSLAAGFVVLVAALQATADERFRELAIMRALGARRRQLAAGLTAEFAAVGAIAGLMGGLGAAGISWALATLALHLPYRPDMGGVALGVAAGVVGVAAAGLLGSRGTLRTAAADALRDN